MVISDLYDINVIISNIEVALQIDGADYEEKNVDAILKNVFDRIIRQYQLDLRETKVTDDVLYMGNSRDSAVLFVENLALLHAKLCGYLQIVRFHKQSTIKPINFNYMGFTPESFKSFCMAAQSIYTIPNVTDALRAISSKFGSVNNCTEKRLILILIVAHKIGLDELCASVSEILYIGMQT